MFTLENKQKLDDLMRISIITGKIEPEAIKLLTFLTEAIIDKKYKIGIKDRKKCIDKSINDIRKLWKHFRPKNQNAYSFFSTSIKTSIVEYQKL